MFDILAQKSPLGVYIAQDGKFCYVNPSCQRFTGYREDELVGGDSSMLVAPEDREKVQDNAARMLQDELFSPHQFRVMCKDGSVRWVMQSVSSIEYHGRRATLGYCMDITERKETEKELSASYAHFNQLAEQSRTWLWEVDANGLYTSVSDVAERVIGYRPEELVGTMHFYDLHPEKGRAELRSAALLKFARKEPLVDLVNPIRTKKDDTVWMSTNGIPMLNSDGSLRGYSGSDADITAQKQAEEKVQHLNQLLRAIRNINQLIAKGADLDSLLKGTCRTLVETRGYQNARIALLNESGKLVTAAEATGSNGSVQITDKPGRRAMERSGLKALEQPGILVIRDLSKCAEPPVTEECRARARMSIRLEHDSKVYGLMTVSIPPGIAVEREEQDLFEEAAGDIAFALYGMEQEERRKNAEEALRTSEERYRTILEEMEDSYFEVDLGGHVTFANSSTCRSLGYSKEELIGTSYKSFTSGDHIQLVFDLFNEVYQSGTPNRGFAWKIARRDGSHGFVETSVSPLRNDEGEIVGFRGVGRDVTERKRMEEELRTQKTYFQRLFDSSPDAIVMLDTDDKIVRTNKGFEALFGYAAEEVTSRPINELVIPDDCTDEASAWSQAVLQGRIVREEVVRKRKDGSLVDVSVVGYPVHLDGQLAGLFVIYSDITKRKAMEKAIRQASEEWRETFDSITDAISIHGRDGRLRRVNKAFAATFHAQPHQLLGKHCYEVMHGMHEPVPGCPHRQTLLTGRPAGAEFFEPNLGIYVETTTSPILDEQGECAGTVHIARDITERKQQSEQLMMADRLASIGELASGTAHQLNNPLTSVIGFSQLLMERDIPDDIREDVGVIYSEAQRAAEVVKNLLTFGRKHTPVKQLHQINQIIEDVLRLRDYEQKISNIAVKRELATSLPDIMVDYFQMQQVFLNIIINAEYFMTEAHNGGTLTITTRRTNGTVRISIADDGPGIDSEDLGQLFNPFFTTKQTGKGTGLGLSICHGIVSEHGGQIYARSRPGEGATFFVELPVNGHRRGGNHGKS